MPRSRSWKPSTTSTGVTDHTYTQAAVIGAPWTAYGMINSVRVGDRVDTQRRRRYQVEETYVSGSVAGP